MLFGHRRRAQEVAVPTAGAGADAGADEPLRRLRLRFVGEVQGVGFRWNSANVARELGLTGWVKNEDNGSVSMELQGAQSHVGAFFSHLLDAYSWRPISYTIDEKDDIAPVFGEKDFRVRY